MVKMLRCNRCFAPLKNESEACEFCGLEPNKEEEKEDFIMEDERLPEEATLDEMIAFFSRKTKSQWKRGFGYGE